ncbi:MAG: arginine--tRNA ligase [Planctomycetaceae bacterium]
MNYLAELRTRLQATLAEFVPEPALYAEMLRPTQDAKFGDFQANCAMPLKAVLGQAPRDIAERIVANWDVADLCDPPTIAGPGFINLRLKDDVLARSTAGLLADERLGVSTALPPKTYVVDFSSPNVAKPMHVGHLRSTVIGNALYQVLTFLGHRVIGDNHIGDWGTQFGMIIYGYKHFRDDAAYQRAPVAELARLYRLVSQLSGYQEASAELPRLKQALADSETALAALKQQAAAKSQDKEAAKALKKGEADVRNLREELTGAEKKIVAVEADSELAALASGHPQIAEGARQETAKLHAGDAENKRLWDEFMPACLAALNGLYERLGITFDLTLGESFYNPMLPGVVADLERRGLAQESDGAMCVFVPGNEAPLIVRKKDGAFTYATSDLATIQYRLEKLQADAMLYVVDARQSEHFQLLFATAKAIGFDGVDYRHVSFGTILGPDRKPYKTRSGDTVGLESLLDEAVARALKIIEDNDPQGELDEAARKQAAETVGLGGVFYADLHHNRDSDYLFDWEKMLAKTGDTATYIQYAFARACGVFRKGEIDPRSVREAAAVSLGSPAERALALQLNRFPEALDDVVTDYRPNLLTQYLFETANRFTEFYEKCPVLKETDLAIRTSRLQLCDLTARVLKQGLKLLGIGVVERM